MASAVRACTVPTLTSTDPIHSTAMLLRARFSQNTCGTTTFSIAEISGTTSWIR